MTKLKGDHETSDPRLDRLPEFDPKSREFPIRTMLTELLPLRSYTWRAGTNLDQGSEGACVGFSWAHELGAYPVAIPATNEFAREKIYRPAQLIDEWPGNDYEGTSVLAGAKIVKSLGFIEEYRWAFGVEDAVRAIGYGGPVVIGINWLDSMFDTRPSGLLDCSGNVAGGHAILARGVTLKSRLLGEKRGFPVVRLRNSWGPDWGYKGDCWLRMEDFERLLLDQGDCCVPISRHHAPVADVEAMEEEAA